MLPQIFLDKVVSHYSFPPSAVYWRELSLL